MLIGEKMNKVAKTKNSIIEILSTRNKTLTEISILLGLAPSTVSQHLKELEATGKIRLADEQHSRKWKYYTLTGKDLLNGSATQGSGLRW